MRIGKIQLAVVMAVVLGILTGGCPGQNILIRGQILDEGTQKPVAGVHIACASAVAVTDSTGNFSLALPGIPATLRISHISYGAFEYLVAAIPRGRLVIRISPQARYLDEVQITGRRMRNLTRGEPYSIQDYAISQRMIWFLGSINNQPNLKRLFLANLYGDTLASVAARGAESLYLDVFGNAHLVMKDSVFQLYTPGEGRIEYPYHADRDRFDQVMEGIELAINQKLVYCQGAPGSPHLVVYYVRENDPVKYQLTVMRDTAEAKERYATSKIDPMMMRWGIPELANMWSTIYRYTKRGTRFDRVINRPVPHSLFHSDSNLYIINYLKDSLLRYSSEGKFLGALPITFHKEPSRTNDRYKSLVFITDPATQKVYMLEKQVTRWILRPVDPKLGEAGEVIGLPDFPGMDQITVYDNAVYFLYQEKTHPYYNRLFRYL